MLTKEIYVRNGNLSNSKYVLMVSYVGEIFLTWYMGDVKIEQIDPIGVKTSGKGMKIEYGLPNKEGNRYCLPFLDEEGHLDEGWTRVK